MPLVSVPTPLEEWQRFTHRPISRRDRTALGDLQSREQDRKRKGYVFLADEQVAWAIRCYATNEGDRPSTHWQDFEQWLDCFREEMPEPLVCRAYLSGNKLLEDAAYRIDLLQSAWFPDFRTEQQIQALKEYVKRAIAD